MIIDELRACRYSLPLTKQIHIRGVPISKREGLIIHLKSGQDLEGFGEIAPLPGLSEETLDDTIENLKVLQKFLVNNGIPENVRKLNGGFKNWFGEIKILPSVQFGVETAVLNLMANAKQIPLYKLISSTFYHPVRLNGLILAGNQNASREAFNMVEQGFKAIKMKVGSNIDEEIKNVQSVSNAIQGKALLHLDANQTWTLNDAVKFGHEVGLATIDYIEEPFKDTSLIPDFFMKTTIPVALDESLNTLSLKEISAISGVDLLILKPMILGGIEKTWQIIEQSQKLAIKTVISSTFESSIGILTLANLASCYPRAASAGLDTLKCLKEDLFKEKINVNRGKMDVANRTCHTDDIRFDMLEKIDLS